MSDSLAKAAGHGLFVAAIAFLAVIALAACSTPKPLTDCPAPAGELMVEPANLTKLPDNAPMSEGDYVTDSLNTVELFRLQRERLVALQGHGVSMCGWSKP